MLSNYALPLYSLVDRDRVDLRSPQLDQLAEHIHGFLVDTIGLEALDGRIALLGGEPYMILNGTPESSLAKLLALADVQKTQLFRYERDSREQATLVPLAVVPAG